MTADKIKQRDSYYIDLAHAIKSGSKCFRARYGALIVAADGKRIIATGFNGKPAGSTNDDICYREGLPPNSPKANCCLHAEANALLFSSSVDRLGGTMYVSGRPCSDCALLIMNSGIARLVYDDRDTESGHPGWSGDDVWKKYGTKLDVVRFSER